jgi:hypothetical protein
VILGSGVEHAYHDPPDFSFDESLDARNLGMIASSARFQCRVDGGSGDGSVSQSLFQCNVLGVISLGFASVGSG